jgi:hypothetical protein
MMRMIAIVVIAASLLGPDTQAKPVAAEAAAPKRTYAIVDTNQREFYGLRGGVIASPASDDAMRGQDAGHEGNAPSYRDNGDGTISDLVTGLMWQKSPDEGAKRSFADAVSGAAACRTGGHEDWRLPTIKELYSLIDFSGGMALSPKKPYIDTGYFVFRYGDESKGERTIDSQWWTSTEYVGTTMRGSPTVFGVNFADGRIKGYPRDRARGSVAVHWVRYVRGNQKYGINDLHDLGDGTVEDRATGLVWAKADAGKSMDWSSALAYASAAEIAGHTDWRLPNAKELQSIVDYSRAPGVTAGADACAIDPIFAVTNPESYYWTSTSHLDDRGSDGPGGAAVYVCFGRAMGWMPERGRVRERGESPKELIDVHGAGAQRSDPKVGDPTRFPNGRGPQGDDVRIQNAVRLVRN